MIGPAISTASLRLAVYVTVRLLSIIGTVGPFVKAFFRFFYVPHSAAYKVPRENPGHSLAAYA